LFWDIGLAVGVLDEFFRFVFSLHFHFRKGHVLDEIMKQIVKDEDEQDEEDETKHFMLIAFPLPGLL
jgi:hypothetical protein